MSQTELEHLRRIENHAALLVVMMEDGYSFADIRQQADTLKDRIGAHPYFHNERPSR